jgi:hypothetical protein
VQWFDKLTTRDRACPERSRRRQKPHRRLSPWASWHNTTKPSGSRGRVNAAFVHGKFTFLSGEVCASRDRRFMREFRKRFNRLTKGTRHIRCCRAGMSPLQWETQNRQQLMINPIAPLMETCGVSTQKSADGIVVSGDWDEGPNVEMSGASNELDVGVEIRSDESDIGASWNCFPLIRSQCVSCTYCRT